MNIPFQFSRQCRFLNMVIIVMITSCKNDPDMKIPEVMEFVEITKITNFMGPEIRFGGFDMGFIGHSATNSLYFAYKALNSENRWGEVVFRLNLNTMEINGNYEPTSDFFTKRIHVINEELVVIGGQYINTYSLDLIPDLINIKHGLELSRFGSVVYKDEIYLWGGDINELSSSTIYKWNGVIVEEIGFLPTAKTWANGSVVDDRIFVFGGQTEVLTTNPNNIIYSYDIEDTAVWTGYLPQPVGFSSTAKYNDLIFVSGGIQTKEAEEPYPYPFPGKDDFDIYFGVFNTQDFTFSEIEINLTDEDLYNIWAMTVMNNKLYVVYGDAERYSYTIMAATLK